MRCFPSWKGGLSIPNFTVKDSGVREAFDSGMVRDTAEDKVDYSLVYQGPMIDRWAAHLTLGAKKYEKNNWMKARGQAELDRFVASACRHFRQWLRGDVDEDHAAATFFNINGAEYVKSQSAYIPGAVITVPEGTELFRGRS